MFITGFVVILLAFYLLIAIFALTMTYLERRQASNTNPFLTALSFLACLFWPVTVMLAVIVLQRKTQATHTPETRRRAAAL
jgi:hypothetical protein